MQLKSIVCKNCGAPLREENIVERLAMARCGHCESVFALAPPDGASRPVLRPELPMPKGIEVEDFGRVMEIRRRWFGPAAWGLLVFSLFWNGFLVVWHSIALAGGMWFMSCFGLLHTAVGIGVGYFTLAMFLNTTTIRVDRGTIEVRHGPLPWGGTRSLSSHEVTQFFCREKVSHGKNGTTVTCDIYFIDRNRQRKQLLSGLQSAEQALYIEQELERHLKIEDHPVQGELPR